MKNMLVAMWDARNLVGKNIVLWRNDSLQLCKVVSVNEEKSKIEYKLLTGPDKGKQHSSLYDPIQTVKAYASKAAALAYMASEKRHNIKTEKKLRRERLKDDIGRAMDILKDCLSRV